ncbi:MAG: ZIP family metal transporter, partial [Burkholderiales bacterium]
MPVLLAALALTLLGSLGGLLLASALLLFNDRVRVRLIAWLVSYAVGTLLGVALLDLLPQALETLAAIRVLATLLGGILLFFILEKLVVWRHCHT